MTVVMVTVMRVTVVTAMMCLMIILVHVRTEDPRWGDL